MKEVSEKSTKLTELLIFPQLRGPCYIRDADTGTISIHPDCVREEKQKVHSALENLMKSVMDERVQLITQQASFSIPWNGQPFITVAVPEEDLINHPNLKMFMTIHVTGEPDKCLPEFQTIRHEISVEKMKLDPTFKSDVPDYSGKYKIRPILLHLSSVSI